MNYLISVPFEEASQRWQTLSVQEKDDYRHRAKEASKNPDATDQQLKINRILADITLKVTYHELLSIFS